MHLLEELDYTIDNMCSFYHMEQPEKKDNILDLYFSGLNLIIDDRVGRAIKLLDDDVKLSLFSDQTKEFFDNQSNKIENLAKILMCKSLGFKTILITSDECLTHSDVNLNINQMDFSKIPPFGYKCKCKIDEEIFNEFKYS